MIATRNLLFIITLTFCWWSGVISSSTFPWFLKDYPTRAVSERPYFDLNSEVLYLNRIDYALLFHKVPEGLFGFRIIADLRTLDVENLSAFQPEWQPDSAAIQKIYPYKSQTSVVADAYAWFVYQMHLPRDTALSVLRFLLVLAAVIAITPIFHLMYKIWGIPAAIALWLWALFSTGFTLFSVSLYWSIYLSILPTTITAIVALRILAGRCGWKTLCVMFLSIMVIACVKFLAGFEFISLIALAPLTPLAMVTFHSKQTQKQSVIAGVLSVMAVMLGFTAAILIYNYLYTLTFGDSGFDYLFSRASAWQKNANDLFATQNNPLRLMVPLWFGVGYVGVPSAVAFILGIGAILYAPFILRNKQCCLEIKTAIIASAFASIASFSWIILQYQHIVFHPRYVTFLVSFPMSLFIVPAMVVVLQKKLFRFIIKHGNNLA